MNGSGDGVNTSMMLYVDQKVVGGVRCQKSERERKE